MAEPLKNMYNKAFLERSADEFSKHFSSFDKKALIKLVKEDSWQDASLIDRMHSITRRMNELLPGSYEKQLKIMQKAAPGITGFEATFFPDFAEMYGQNFPELSLPYLKYVTQFSTSEFAIRPFILIDPKGIMGELLKWSKDENEHVRRLSSEGCRPRLPWAIKLQPFIDDPAPIFPILESLKTDDSKYVQKSVANNLNDISKEHDALVIKIAGNWRGKNNVTDWIIKHACRTLLKAGHPDVMPIFGYQKPACIKITRFDLEKDNLQAGEVTKFNSSLVNKSKDDFKLRLEYIVAYPRKSHHYEKVFFIKEKDLKPGEELNFSGKIDVEEKSTRKIHPGKMPIIIQINGTKMLEKIVTLKV